MSTVYTQVSTPTLGTCSATDSTFNASMAELHWIAASYFPSYVTLFLSPVRLFILQSSLLVLFILSTRGILSIIHLLQPCPRSSTAVWLSFLYVPILFLLLPHGIIISAGYVFLSHIKRKEATFCSFCVQGLLHCPAYTRVKTGLLNEWMNKKITALLSTIYFFD